MKIEAAGAITKCNGFPSARGGRGYSITVVLMSREESSPLVFPVSKEQFMEAHNTFNGVGSGIVRITIETIDPVPAEASP